MGTPSLGRYVRDKLLDPGTWVTALVVGTLINAYGHGLVPWLRGEPDVLGRFGAELRDAPWVTAFSVLVGYLFPVLVGTWASVRTRWALRHLEFPT